MEFDEFDYTDGKSHVMAIAIRRLYGGRFALLCEDDGVTENSDTGEPAPAVHHVYVVLPDGRVADVEGIRDNRVSLDEWEDMNEIEGAGGHFSVVAVDDEQDLEKFVTWDESLPLDSFAESDVADAQEFFLLHHHGDDRPSSGPYLH